MYQFVGKMAPFLVIAALVTMEGGRDIVDLVIVVLGSLFVCASFNI